MDPSIKDELKKYAVDDVVFYDRGYERHTFILEEREVVTQEGIGPETELWARKLKSNDMLTLELLLSDLKLNKLELKKFERRLGGPPIAFISIYQEQDDRLRAWQKKHRDEAHAKGVRDMSGAWMRYTIIPTGMGDNIEAECIWCPGTKIILTLDDDGDFLFNEDGSKNGWS